MRLLNLIIFSTLSFYVSATELNICINEELDVSKKSIGKNYLLREVLFKNVYETLFYLEPTTNKIFGNLAKRIIPYKKDSYEIVLKENVLFHNNRIFFVKKTLTPKDVVFSLKRTHFKFIKNVYIKDKKILIDTSLSLKSLYKRLSRPDTIILSSAYYNYLNKKKKSKLFWHRPLGTGPFTLKSLSKPYNLKRFSKYHLKNRLEKLNYKITNKYIKESCDIFWKYTSFTSNQYTQKYKFKSNESKENSLLFLHIPQSRPDLYRRLMNISFHKDILVFYGAHKAKSLFPSHLYKSIQIPLIHNQKTVLKKRYKLLVSDSNIISELSGIVTKIQKLLLKNGILVDLVKNEKLPYDFSIKQVEHIYTSEDIHEKILCPYKSSSCNIHKTPKEIHGNILLEKKFIPLGYFTKKIFYRKKIENLKVNFEDSIDYSEVLYIN